MTLSTVACGDAGGQKNLRRELRDFFFSKNEGPCFATEMQI